LIPSVSLASGQMLPARPRNGQKTAPDLGFRTLLVASLHVAGRKLILNRHVSAFHMGPSGLMAISEPFFGPGGGLQGIIDD
jgi:hypothetical protein